MDGHDDAGPNSTRDRKPKPDTEIGQVEYDDEGVELRVPKHGHGRLRRGNPDAKGRPPLSWQEKCRRLATRKSSLRAVSTILQDPHHEAFATVYKFVAEQAYGKAVARHVVRDESPARADEMAKALTIALSDPGVRAWLERERPEVMGALAGLAGHDEPATLGSVIQGALAVGRMESHPLNPAKLLQSGDDLDGDLDDDQEDPELTAILDDGDDDGAGLDDDGEDDA